MKLSPKTALNLSATLVFLVLSCLIYWTPAQAEDESISRWVQAQSGPVSDALMWTITHGGDRLTLFLFTSALTILFLVRRKKKLAGKHEIAAVWLAIGIGYTVNYALKALFARSRPELSPLLLAPSGYSYPSGHAMVSTIVYGCAAYLLAQAWPRAKGWIYGTAVAWVCMIGLSRIYLDAHWPSDVLAGFAAGWLIIAGIAIWYDRNRPVHAPE